ncbi:MAG: DNA-3-methyladenine glycosylase [Calditrichia bacterium]|nr:DNA-3-methyladenine glycosylase [Calditrichia bacterium]
MMNALPRYSPLPRSFYYRPTLAVARELLGARLVRRLDNGLQLVGKIVETEAYIGEEDPACHAARGRTPRTAIMYGPPGYAYIYFTYGMHHCLNAVTEREGFPAAALIRAVEPLEGLETMREFYGRSRGSRLTDGPGKLCRAFALDRSLNGADLCGEILFIAAGEEVAEQHIAVTPRIGIRSGKEYPWRFCLKNNSFVSR